MRIFSIPSTRWLALWLVMAIVGSALGVYTSTLYAFAPDPQQYDSAQGVATVLWLDNGDGTWTREVTINGTVVASPATDRENASLTNQSKEHARQQAKIRLIAVKDDLLLDLQTPGAPELHRAIQAILDIIEMME